MDHRKVAGKLKKGNEHNSNEVAWLYWNEIQSHLRLFSCLYIWFCSVQFLFQPLVFSSNLFQVSLQLNNSVTVVFRLFQRYLVLRVSFFNQKRAFFVFRVKLWTCTALLARFVWPVWRMISTTTELSLWMSVRLR